METSMLAPQGVFPSITWDVIGRRWLVVWQDGHSLFFNDGRVHHINGGETSFPRLYYYQDKVWLTYRDGAPPHHGHLMTVGSRILEVANLGQVHGMYPTVMGMDWVAWQCGDANAGYPVNRARFDSLHNVGMVSHGKPTGLALITTAGDVLTWDDVGRQGDLHNTTFAGFIMCGATDRNGEPCVVVRDPRTLKELVLWPGEDSLNPTLAWDMAQGYSVVVWSGRGQGVRQATFNINELTTPVSTKPAPFGVLSSAPKSLGYFFGRRSKYGEFDPSENTAVLPLDAFQDSDGSHPPDVGDQLRTTILEVGRGIVSNTAIEHVAPVWSFVLGVFAGEQQGNVWAHEPVDRAEADRFVRNAHDEMTRLNLPTRPVIVILREERSADKQFVGCADALAPELYFRQPEATYETQLAVARARIDAIYNALAPDQLYICVQAFDRASDVWKHNIDKIEAIQQAANEAITRDRVKGLLWFAYSRPGGTYDHPELEPWHVAQVAVTTVPDTPTDTEPPTPEPPEGEDMTHDDIRRYAAEIQDTPLFGAMQRYHNEVLPRDRPRDTVIQHADNGDMWTGDVVTGGANAYLMRALISEYLIARDKGRTMEQALGDGYDAAKKSYDKAVGNPQ